MIIFLFQSSSIHATVLSKLISDFFDDLCLKTKEAYVDNKIPEPYPAANKQLQLRLTQVLPEDVLINFGNTGAKSTFDFNGDRQTQLITELKELGICLLVIINEN
ncbi:hypothetical protein I4U23_010429 [Adineta vaga]|nr:hypothetical protein I4U23_010429 [Adineta vaga]